MAMRRFSLRWTAYVHLPSFLLYTGFIPAWKSYRMCPRTDNQPRNKVRKKKKKKEKEKPWGICGPPTGGGMSEEHNESRYRYKVLGIHGDTRPRQSLLFSLLGTGRSTLAIHAVKLERLR